MQLQAPRSVRSRVPRHSPYVPGTGGSVRKSKNHETQTGLVSSGVSYFFFAGGLVEAFGAAVHARFAAGVNIFFGFLASRLPRC
ncbi:protein of unknown function (plasmid) [Pararobbsia alpina]